MIPREAGEYTTRETRREAYEEVDKKKRKMEILNILDDVGRGMTAKEVAVEMHRRGLVPTSERNFAAPRLTEMAYEGSVDVVGKTICEYTGKKVAVYVRRCNDSQL